MYICKNFVPLSISFHVTYCLQEEGKPTTKTLIFERPIIQEELDTIWDEQTLRLLVS